MHHTRAASVATDDQDVGLRLACGYIATTETGSDET